jgi:hypothetical protein
MTKVRSFPSLILVAVFLVACGPAEGPAPTNPPAATAPATVLSPTETDPAATLESSPPAEATALPIATSRGPDLHATDPTTVSLASGGLQFVEFFRFT